MSKEVHSPPPGVLPDGGALRALADYVTEEQYCQMRRDLFPAPQSWRWFSRQNYQRLLEIGALAYPNGKLRLHPERVDKVVVEAGLAAAQRKRLNPEGEIANDHT
jgi:hypothetical protein